MSDDPRTDGAQTEDSHTADPEDLRAERRRTGDGGPERPRRLTRRGQDKVLGGVAGGLADYFGVDPLVARLVFAGLALYGGFGVLAYLLCWLLIPVDDDSAEDATGGKTAARATGVVLIVVAGLVILPNLLGGLFGWWGPGLGGPAQPGLVFGLLVIAGGYALYRYGDRERSRTDQEPAGHAATATMPSAGPATARPPGASAGAAPAAPAASGPGASTRPPGPAGGEMASSGAYAAVPARGEPAEPARPPSPLGRLTLALALLVVGVAALLERTDVLSLGASQLLALGLLVVGLGLLVGAWWGRARWLIAVGMVLTPVVLVAALISSATPWDGPGLTDLRRGAGDVEHQPTSIADLRDSYELSSGRLVLDLQDLELAENEVVDVRADVAAGEIEVLLPPAVHMEVTGRALVGAVRVPGDERAGVLVESDRTDIGAGGPDAPTVRLDLSVLAGQVVVRDSPAGAFDQSPSTFQGER